MIACTAPAHTQSLCNAECLANPNSGVVSDHDLYVAKKTFKLLAQPEEQGCLHRSPEVVVPSMRPIRSQPCSDPGC